MRRRWLLLGVPIALVGGWWLSRALATGAEVRWTEVRRGDLVLGVEVTGTLRAVETSFVGPPQLREYWDFKIARMLPEGQAVRAGTPVLELDTSTLEAQLERQTAESDEARKQIEKTEKELAVSRRRDELRLAEAEARLRKAKLVVDRPAELSQSKELDLARLDLKLAQKEVALLRQRREAARRAAEAHLAVLRNQRERADQRTREIRDAIERMTRRAPRDATVIHVADWNDNKKKVGDSVWIGESVIELPDLKRMQAAGRVDEADAGRLREGQLVVLRLDAHPDLEFGGRVAAIRKTVRRESSGSPNKVVQVEIELDDTDRRRMRPGMRFRGRIETARIQGALLVPAEAVFPTDAGPVVFRRAMFGHQRIRVELGRRNESRVEVVGGLDEGDAVSLIALEEQEPAT